jgi:two-component system, response regulator YesN
VLLADDEPVIIRGLKKIIPWNKYGLEIIGDASNGIELLKNVKEKSPDLIISDISMPGLSGMDVIKQARELNLPAKFIFVSAFSDSYLKETAKDYGAYAYLVKPINKVELEKAVLSAIG